ncbi:MULTISPECIES: hypothetical protein [Bradyrhizobium]|uniref:hypothetical protein n=1 Tax=Bradyrhizobium TaxID=374 RepID=UPI00155E53A0|nr:MULTISPECIES: hypothetical protein [Bradyrhizobium]MDD1520663.1 hypothetical protein [Bradyrhizobium sp. WBAH30]MDD1545715.1 hypothetical protein [Bradyrhizobium sp. WBAH41]MDD1559024.1 hypothetical protein [Bradyrhizobium sp. WBAH23]MDD1566324.1 hypothetical protein [Bradyrhizobium sp. WBAH33]MDD1591919.1 hypothetical protein [Bradyrhizobium sp. WBAH42]
MFDVIAEGESLRFEARKIKDDLPFILRTSSAEGLAELTARLWECAGLARKLANLREDLRVVLRHITEFDKELSNRWTELVKDSTETVVSGRAML